MLAGWLARCVVSAPPHHDGYVCLANNATAAELEIMMGTLGSSGERGEHSRKHKLGITFFFLFPSVRLLLIHTYTNTHTHTLNQYLHMCTLDALYREPNWWKKCTDPQKP